MKLDILNVRLGLATNSSSSHSIIFLDGNKRVKDDSPAGEFGWEFFTAASNENKKRYVGATLYGNLRRLVSDEEAARIAQEWSGAPVTTDDYVDHQSAFDLPHTFNGEALHRGFFDDFRKFMLQPNVVILGGNDNDSKDHPLLEGNREVSLPIPRDNANPNLVCRWDKTQRFWTIFNKDTGAKIRFRFLTNSDEPPMVKAERASAPELVDVKITDFCPYGCSYCYQGSTTAGKHASHAYLGNLYAALRDLEVFEVAIGGGEPTLHPEFLGILRLFRSHGIVPNFTTRNLAWLNDPKMRRPILENCGAIGFSVDTPEQVAGLHDALGATETDTHRFVAQVVVGAVPAPVLEQILRDANKIHLRVLLLGYKTTGRGSEVQPHEYDWAAIVAGLREKYELPTLGIDTALAATSVKRLEDLGIPAWMYGTQEGRFSCYVDAVAQKIGPSSYCDPAEMQPLPRLTGNEIAATFQSFA